jgi:hypothetical protein
VAEETPAPEVAEVPETVAFTIDDDGNVLELIRSATDGVFVREDGDWVPVDADEEQPTIDDMEWADTTRRGIAFWDSLDEDERDITRDKIEKYLAPSE